MEIFSAAAFAALLQVVAIDLVLAGDNAIVIGLAAAGLPADQRKKAILIGVVAATGLRILFASVTVQLLQLVGLLRVGGLLLLCVCGEMWRGLRNSTAHEEEAHKALASANGEEQAAKLRKTLMQAATQIVIADVSMSLDNVSAVAGAARDHLPVLVIGLVLSIALMGLAASFIAKIGRAHV